MSARSIIIDCDPGLDDAIGLLLAMSAPDELEILGITTVAGNVPLELTQRNACIVRDVAGRGDVPVFAGCARPLRRELITAEAIHGATGLGEIEIVTPKYPVEDRHAVDFIVETLRARPDESTTLVLTGPLTNAATAIARDREILRKISAIVLMGGAMREAGNYSPSAEFNFLLDPHAAAIVLQCGRPITMLGLDATHQVLVSPAVRERIARINNDPGRATRQMLDYYARHDSERFGGVGVPLHDPCTVAWLLQPGLFTTRDCFVAVETQSGLTAGHTAVDFWGVTGQATNVAWVYEVDADGVFDLLVEHLDRFPAT
jgi:purine nucleosidase